MYLHFNGRHLFTFQKVSFTESWAGYIYICWFFWQDFSRLVQGSHPSMTRLQTTISKCRPSVIKKNGGCSWHQQMMLGNHCTIYYLHVIILPIKFERYVVTKRLLNIFCLSQMWNLWNHQKSAILIRFTIHLCMHTPQIFMNLKKKI